MGNFGGALTKNLLLKVCVLATNGRANYRDPDRRVFVY